MLSEVCRVAPSIRRSFSRTRTALLEAWAKNRGTEYGLMAQTVYLQELLEAGGEADQY